MENETPSSVASGSDVTGPVTTDAAVSQPTLTPAATPEMTQAQITSLQSEVKDLLAKLDAMEEKPSADFDFTPEDVSALVAACPYEKLKGLYHAADSIRVKINERWSSGK